ncbi:MAG: hypothetical protein Q8936_08455 [Bacillota bacterium]|nr:hypothetical protein [Bacillota bacterium]
MDYIKNNLIALSALIVSIESLLISLKNYLKSIVKLKISYNINNSYSLGFYWYEPYKLLIVDLAIENNSTSAADISFITLIDGNSSYLASKIELSDRHNSNGITLINDDDNLYLPIDISTKNILNNPRVSSYGFLNGFAVFQNIEPLEAPRYYKIIVKTPSKSFKKKIKINPLNYKFQPIHPLEI